MVKKNKVIAIRYHGMIIHPPEKECNDKKCPFHGNLKVRGRMFVGTVISDRMQNTVTVEWQWTRLQIKYERFEMSRTRVKAHNPMCINAKEGDKVRIIETRPISKTKQFVVVEKLGENIDYKLQKIRDEEQKAKEEHKEKEKPKQEAKKKIEEAE